MTPMTFSHGTRPGSRRHRTDGEGSLRVLCEACYDVTLVLAAQGRSP
ncbi:hypothetical protein [Streptomyces sp. NPDC000851]